MSTGLTKEDLWDVRDRLEEQIRDGFDSMNGRLRKNETYIARVDERLISVERKTDARATGTDLVRPITGRDVKVAWLTLAGAVSVIEGIYRFGPLIRAYLVGHP